MSPLAQIPLADAFVLDLMEPWIDHTLQNVVDKLRPGGRLVVTCTCAGVACQHGKCGGCCSCGVDALACACVCV